MLSPSFRGSLLLALGSTASAAEKVDYRQSLAGREGVVAVYPVSYAVPAPTEVKATIDRIAGHVIANTSLRVFDNAAGVEITTADLANPNPAAVLDGRFPHVNRWDYPNGVTWSAFLRVTEFTGDRRYAEHVVKVYDFIFTFFVGATVYAGAEIIRLLGNPALQIQPPRPNAVNSALHLKPAN